MGDNQQFVRCGTKCQQLSTSFPCQLLGYPKQVRLIVGPYGQCILLNFGNSHAAIQEISLISDHYAGYTGDNAAV